MRIKIFGRVIYIPSWVKFAAIILFFIVLAIIGSSIRKGKNIVAENPSLLSDTEKPVTVAPTPTSTIQLQTPYNTSAPPTTASLTVYVIGCVANPSVVTVPYGSIIQNAVDAAGGLTDDADPTKINMAYPLSDNMMIKIPSLHDNDSDVSDYSDNWIITAPPQKTDTQSSNETGELSNNKININTANLKTLCNLPGIGESTAQKIIDYREKNGSFEHIEDIMKVPGIKQSRFDTIKDMITV